MKAYRDNVVRYLMGRDPLRPLPTPRVLKPRNIRGFVKQLRETLPEAVLGLWPGESPVGKNISEAQVQAAEAERERLLSFFFPRET